MRYARSLLHIESHRQQRVDAFPVVPAPVVGRRWGAKAEFEFEPPSREEQEARDRGGLTIRNPPEYRHEVRVHNFSPVWRQWDVVRVPVEGDPELFADVRVTRQVLIYLGEQRLRYVYGGVGYVADPGNAVYEERVVHSYLLLKIALPDPEANVVGQGEEGEWPDYPRDTQFAGPSAPSSPYGDEDDWDR